MLTWSLLAVACVAGIAGTWSPCGFSIIDTISAPRRETAASCIAFAVGACAGGAATFTALAALGAAARTSLALHATVVAPVLAVAAALAEVRAAAIVPQIRRQVPEHWRRVPPLPAAVALYGVLLGAGFTTFVLTFAVWALAALAFLLATPQLGLELGIAFGVGRALPVALIAPIAQRPLGRRIVDAMAQRPRTLSTLRRLEAVGLVGVAVATLTVTPVRAATKLGAGTDPSAAPGVVVWTSPAGGVARHDDGTTVTVPPHSTVGGTMIAWRDGESVHVARLADMTEVLVVAVPGVDAIAVSDSWLVTRSRTAGVDTVAARTLSTPDAVRTVASARQPAQLGRPALEGSTLVYHVASTAGSRIVAVDLDTSTSRVIRRSASQLLTNPSILGINLVYDRQTNAGQLVEVGPTGTASRDRVVYRIGAPAVHDVGHERGYSRRTRTPHPRAAQWALWTTALSTTRVYVTLLPRTGSAQRAQLVSVSR